MPVLYEEKQKHRHAIGQLDAWLDSAPALSSYYWCRKRKWVHTLWDEAANGSLKL